MKIAYSKYFKSYIRCMNKRSDNNWYFRLCDEQGNIKSDTTFKAQTRYSFFNWREIKK